MVNLLVFLAVLSVLVMIHELGHLLVAKLLGIRVEEFAFGLPLTKPLFKVGIGETQLAFYPLLLGGFVRLYGEEKDVQNDKKRSFWNRSAGQRLAVIAAGVVMNVVLAIAGFMALYNALGVPEKIVDKVTVDEVKFGTPADKAGIRAGDRLVAVEGTEVARIEDYSRLIKSWAGLKTHVTIERGTVMNLMEGILVKEKQTLTVELVPRKDPPANEGATGVAIDSYPYFETRKCSIFKAQCSMKIIKAGLGATKIWVERVYEGLRSMGGKVASGEVPKDVAGPIGVFQIVALVSKQGFWPLVELLAVLSINLAVFNFLPIPALDGGRALFVVLEVLFRKRIPNEIEQRVNSWGFAVLLAVMAAASLQDVIRLGWFGK